MENGVARKIRLEVHKQDSEIMLIKQGGGKVKRTLPVAAHCIVALRISHSLQDLQEVLRH